MSQYKSAAFRSQQPAQPAGEPKHRRQAQQLLEIFPDYSVEGTSSSPDPPSRSPLFPRPPVPPLRGRRRRTACSAENQRRSCFPCFFSPPSQSPAVTGHAEQWGSVKSKRDKKPPPPSAKDHPTPRDRTDSRGARGGRGGRGGATRGARGRGSPRGAPGVNGRASRPSHPGKTSSPAPDFADKQPVEDFSDPVQPDKSDWSNGIPHDSPSDPNHTPDLPASDTPFPAQSSSTPSSWDTSPWGAQDHFASAPPTSSQPISAAPRPTKLPATSKLSWAQIARSEISSLLYSLPPPHAS